MMSMRQSTSPAPPEGAVIAYVALLLLVFVGFTPFSGGGGFEELSGDGSSLRQITFTLVCVPIWFLAAQHYGKRVLSIMPLSLISVLLWILFSVGWSVAPDVSLRRAILLIMVTSATFFSVSMLGASRALNILRKLLGTVIVLDLIAVPILPGAQHIYEGSMVWAGLHGHKNTAGAVASLAAMLFLHFWRVQRRMQDGLLLIFSIAFLVGTQSKTAGLLLVGLFLVDTVYRFSQETRLRKKLFRFMFLKICTIFAVVTYIYRDTVFAYLDDPTLLTGRGVLWQIAFSYIGEHPWFGSGFAAFWDGGSSPPARAYLSYGDDWVLGIGHSHNSYIEITVTTGVFGLMLSMLALIVIPLRRLLQFRIPNQMGALVFSWTLFAIIGSVTKSQFVDRDRPEWVVYVIALAIIHMAPLARKGPQAHMEDLRLWDIRRKQVESHQMP